VALEPGSEQQDVNLPADYHAHHPEEHAEDWGWHGEWGRWAHVAGWVVVVILLLMITATHYNGQGTLFLSLFAVGLVVGLIWDRQRRKNAWRS
jgi:hypothetical protein